MSGPLQQRSVKLSEPFRIPLCSVLYLKSYTYPCNSQLNSLLCIHNVHNVLSLKRSNSCFFFVQQQLYTVVPVHCTIECAAGNEATWLGKRWVVWGGEQRRELIHQLPDIAFLMRNALWCNKMHVKEIKEKMWTSQELQTCSNWAKKGFIERNFWMVLESDKLWAALCSFRFKQQLPTIGS